MALEDTIDVTELTGLVETDSVEEANTLITQDEAVLLHASFGETKADDRFVLGYYARAEPQPQPQPPAAPSAANGQEDFVETLPTPVQIPPPGQ